MLTAIVFVFWPEEEDYADACFKSISFADEILVIDNGASRKTLDIVKKYTHKIISTTSKDFSERHNLASKHASGDWLLFIDADERVSLPLRQEILEHLKNPQFDAYELSRINFFLGKKVRFGDRFPDYVTRLFNRQKLLNWTGSIHESSHVNGAIGRLDRPLYHLTHRDIFSMLAKTINYSQNEAELRFLANHPPVVWWRFPRVVASELYIRLIKYQGWRGGTEGWIDAFFQALSMFVVYARLWELQRKPTLEKTYQEIDQKIINGETL